MSDLSRHVERATCRCTRCVLVQCEVLSDEWPEWREIDFAGHARVAMVLLTRREPPVWPDARRRWAGAIPWFDVAGCGLEFEEEAW